jgi:hypothetical protein
MSYSRRIELLPERKKYNINLSYIRGFMRIKKVFLSVVKMKKNNYVISFCFLNRWKTQ